ncbi:MAG: phosphotransferase [Myxococcota bacterium]
MRRPEEAQATHPAAVQALSHWSIEAVGWALLPQGNINESHLVQTIDGDRFVLQRVSEIFDPRVCRDIQQVTKHLKAKGLNSPQVVESREGGASAEVEGQTWRLSTWVPGRVFKRVEASWQAEEAGRALAAFHRGMADYARPFEARRLGVHDSPAHLAGLEAAVAQGQDAPRREEIVPVAEAILEFWRATPRLELGPERVVHGDPKLANLVFEEHRDRWAAWIDLDTVGPMALALELGDAFRSWCQPAGEDTEGQFERPVFEAGCRGYAAGCLWPEEASKQLVLAVETISIELAARFCRDAFECRYFGWDARRFPDASAHHLARARSQLAFALSVRSSAAPAQEACERTFHGKASGP